MGIIKNYIKDWISWLVGFGGAIITLVSLCSPWKENYFYTLLFGAIFQLGICIIWAVHMDIVYEKNKDIEKLQQLVTKKNKDIETLNTENEKLNISMQEQLAETRRLCGELAISIKNASKHYNEYSARIAYGTQATYEEAQSYLLNKSDDKDQENKDIREKIKRIHDRYQNILFDIYNNFSSKLLVSTVELLNKYLEIRGIKLKVAASIKLFNKPYDEKNTKHNDVLVYTAFRDRWTYEQNKQREICTKTYSIDGNSDFTHCLCGEYYASNDVSKDDSNYLNEHQDFDRYYNCTVVVPIKSKQDDNRYVYYGYVCCDCLNDNKEIVVFDENSGHYLYMIAQLYANFLETLDSNRQERLNKNGNDLEDNVLSMIYEKAFKKI